MNGLERSDTDRVQQLRRSPRLNQNAQLRPQLLAQNLERSNVHENHRPLPLSRLNTSINSESVLDEVEGQAWLDVIPIVDTVGSLDDAIRGSKAFASDNRYGATKYGLAVSQGIGLKGSRLLVQALAKEPLHALRLEFRLHMIISRISPYHSRIFRTFSKGFNRFTFLKCLRINLNGVALDFSRLPPSLSMLRLEFSPSKAERKSLESLAVGLRRAKCLTKLELFNCSFEPERLSLLSLGNTSLTYIAIRGDIGDVYVDAFIKSWRNDSPLQDLRLEGNPALTNIGVQRLLQATTHHRAFESLKLIIQETAQFDVLKTVAQEFSTLKLRKLGIKLTFHRNTNYTASQQAVHALAQGIKGNYFIWDPSQIVDSTQIVMITQSPTSESTKVICSFSYLLDDYDFSFHLKRNQLGACLLLDNSVAASVWCHVFAKCRFDPSVTYSFLRERPELIQCRQSE